MLLAVTANGYGYHRDELYFRLLSRHLAWGYVDQPPMTPALVRASTAAFGDTLFALRMPAIICLVVTIFIVAAIAREFGGGPSAQLVAAIGTVGPFPLIAGHTLLTASPDMVFWTLAILFVVRALLRDEPRWWLWAGVVVGVSLWNKQLIVLLLLGLLARAADRRSARCVPAMAVVGRYRDRRPDRRADADLAGDEPLARADDGQGDLPGQGRRRPCHCSCRSRSSCCCR